MRNIFLGTIEEDLFQNEQDEVDSEDFDED